MYYDYHTELDLIKEWTHLTEISLLAIHQQDIILAVLSTLHLVVAQMYNLSF